MWDGCVQLSHTSVVHWSVYLGDTRGLPFFWGADEGASDLPRGWMCRLERGESPWVFVLCAHRAAVTAQHPC